MSGRACNSGSYWLRSSKRWSIVLFTLCGTPIRAGFSPARPSSRQDPSTLQISLAASSRSSCESSASGAPNMSAAALRASCAEIVSRHAEGTPSSMVKGSSTCQSCSRRGRIQGGCTCLNLRSCPAKKSQASERRRSMLADVSTRSQSKLKSSGVSAKLGSLERPHPQAGAVGNRSQCDGCQRPCERGRAQHPWSLKTTACCQWVVTEARR